MSGSFRLDGRLVKETLADGSYWETTYNDTERTVTRIKKDAAHETLTQESYKLDSRGNITSYTDEKNQTTTREYDKLNRLIAETRPTATRPVETTSTETSPVETHPAVTSEAAPQRTDINYNGNTITITQSGEKLILTKDGLCRITSILNQDANNQTLSETTYTYAAEKNTITETKSEESTTTDIEVNKDPVNWTDLAGKLAKGFNTGWNRDATTSNSIAFNIGNYLGAFLADASDMFPAVGITEAITGQRFLGHKELSPQQRILSLTSAGMSVLPIALITKAAGGAKVLVGIPNRTVGNVVRGMPDPYVGIKEASLYLQNMGVPHARRIEILRSFNPENIIVRQAGEAEFGLRFYSNLARPGGSYLFETFPASRASLAIKPEWNSMIGFRQYQIRPGQYIFERPSSTTKPILAWHPNPNIHLRLEKRPYSMNTSINKHASLLTAIESAIMEIGEEIKKSKDGAEALDDLPHLQFIKSKLKEIRAILSQDGWQNLSRSKPGMARLVVDTWPLNNPLGEKICEIEYEYERLK